MEQIIIGFSTPKKENLFSKLIKLIEKTDYSHVYIKFYSESYQRWLIYQASGLEVNFIGEERFDEKEIIIKEFILEITQESKQKMIQYCIDMIGLPYDFKGIIGIGLVLLFKLKKNPFSSNQGALFCSKAAEYILEDFFNVILNKDPNLVLPKDIYNYLNE